MELTPEPGPLPAPRWSDPQPAYPATRVGMSPYLHYFHDLRRSQTMDGNENGDLLSPFAEAVRALVEEAFE